MNFNVPVTYLDKMKATLGEDRHHNMTKWHSREDSISIEADRFTEAEIKQLTDLADKGRKLRERGANGLFLKLGAYRNMCANPDGYKVNKLEQLVYLGQEYVRPAPHKWLFNAAFDGRPVPFYVERIEYTGPSRDHGPYVTFKLKAYSKRVYYNSGITYYSSDIGGRTVRELLMDKGYYLENPELVAEYEKAVLRYKEVVPMTGDQFDATGQAHFDNYWGGGKISSMEREGAPTRVIVDDVDNPEDEENRKREGSLTGSTSFWKRDKVDPDDEEEVSDEIYYLPVLPYVQVFDLDKHDWCNIHAQNLTEYKYDTTMVNKLVLPEHKKNLINILVAGSTDYMDDIIKGKMRGVIVIATGAPGTGKTLTAEVFSEEIQRPLYTVQCSQLGTNEEELEKELKVVLARASRWKAILLIDEADVYIHERGNDIQQNAIVGVFLRVLEYYKGVLFMTSNRATIIDDAIMSRATAWIKYDKPSKDELRQIWKVLSTNYRVTLKDSDIEKLVEEFSHISGRNVRNLLKLARLLSTRTKKAIDVELIKYVSQFQDLDTKEEK